jgi:hypothetical protein
MRIPIALTLTIALAPALALGDCFALHGADGQVISQAHRPPFSLDSHGPPDPARIASQARGEHLVIAPGSCFVGVGRPAPEPRGDSARLMHTSWGGGGGICDTPDQRDSAGRRCGARAASARPGGR